MIEMKKRMYMKSITTYIKYRTRILQVKITNLAENLPVVEVVAKDQVAVNSPEMYCNRFKIKFIKNQKHFLHILLQSMEICIQSFQKVPIKKYS